MAGYCICGGIAAGTIPQIYAPAKWYYIIVMCKPLLSDLLPVCTDWQLLHARLTAAIQQYQSCSCSCSLARPGC